MIIKNKSRFRFFIFIGFLLLFLSSFIIEFNHTWTENSEIKHATLGVKIVDLQTKETIYEINSDKVLCAASSQKILSSLVAMDQLGSDYVFETKVYTNGVIDGELLKGNIYICPNNNPTLASSRFSKTLEELTVPLLSYLKQNGIKVIGGNIIVVDPTYETETLPRTWIWEDIGNYYGANPSGTILNENILEIVLKSEGIGEQVSVVSTSPVLPWIDVYSRAIGSSINRDLAYAFSAPNAKDIYVEGTIPSNRNSFKIKASLPNPQKALCYLVFDAIEKSGINVKGKYKVEQKFTWTNPIEMASIKSPQLIHIVKEINQNSVNILAESVLNEAYQKSGTSLEKGEWVKSVLSEKFKVNTDGMILKDACGLSRFNAVSADQFVQSLLAISKLESWDGVLPTSGQSGTLRSMFTKDFLNGLVKAKSGSMQGVRSYVGYSKTKSGKEVCFAIVINNFDCSNSTIKQIIEDLLYEKLNY